MKESKYKYKVASWLQEIARNNFSFKKDKNYDFALQKNDYLVGDYLSYREKHFAVIKKQFSQLIVFKIIITASLLSIGGYLVLSQQMNIGQFVASEIIILLVIGSVEKIILGLETLYDVLTAVEKIGQVTDLQIETIAEKDAEICYSKIAIEAEKLNFKFPDSTTLVLSDINIKIDQGEKILISGDNGSGKTTLIRILSGFMKQTSGTFFINDDTFRKINIKQYRSQIGTIITGETPFEGTILQNITFNQKEVSEENLKWAIDAVQLTPYIKTLSDGLDTLIFPEGKQLSSSNAQKILLARAIIGNPKILYLEDPTDKMDDDVAKEIIAFLTSVENKWTVIVSSKNPYWIEKCCRNILMESGKIISDSKI